MVRQSMGLAVIGCGSIGRVRAELAREHPGVGWIGVCDVRGQATHHATAADGHRTLLITMAIDKSAHRGKPIDLIPEPATLVG